MIHRDVAKRDRSRAKLLRTNMTDAERCIWHRLRAHRFKGQSFRRQFPIGPYVADFVCLEARLIIEVDGGQHADNPRDVARDEWLRSQHFTILRFWNNDVLSNLTGVLETIAGAMTLGLPPSLTLPRKGGGNRAEQDDS